MKHILIPATIIMSIAFSQNVLAQSDDKTIADCLDAANIKPQPQHTLDSKRTSKKIVEEHKKALCDAVLSIYTRDEKGNIVLIKNQHVKK